MERVKTVALGAAVLIMVLCNGCANMKPAASMDANGSAPAAGAPASVPQSYYLFPDLSVPVELEQDMNRTMIIKTQQFQGGIVVLKGRVTVSSLMEYFPKKMMENGWQLVGSMAAKRSLLAFSKGNQGHCLIQIYDTPGGFSTEVQIWLVEPMDAFAPQQPPPPPPAGDIPNDFPPAS